MKFFPSRPDEDKNELFLFTSEGKIKPRIRILASQHGSFEMALSSLDLVL